MRTFTSQPDRSPVPASCDLDEGLAKPSKHSPKQWIYRNLTPFRIHASFAHDGTLLTAVSRQPGLLPRQGGQGAHDPGPR